MFRQENQRWLHFRDYLQEAETLGLVTCVHLSVVVQSGHGAKRRGTELALKLLFVGVGSQVTDDSTLVRGNKAAETASEPDVLGGF